MTRTATGVLLCLLSLGALARPASASTLISDTGPTQTTVRATNTGADPANNGSFVDVLGSPFDTTSLAVGFGGNGVLGITLRTTYDGTAPAGVTPLVRYADLFIDTDGIAGGDGAFSYELAIPLVDHDGFSKTKVYAVAGSQSSRDLFGAGSGATPGLQYGGAYRTPDGVYRGLVPVSLTAGTALANVTVSQTIGGPTAGHYEVALAISGWVPPGGTIALLWGTGTCANDTVWGTAPVPLPAALPLFLGALAGLGLIGRRNGGRQPS